MHPNHFQPWQVERLANEQYYNLNTIIDLGGAGSGKSVGKAKEAAIGTYHARNWQVFRQDAVTLRGSCYNEVVDGLNEMGLVDDFHLMVSGNPMQIINKVTGYGIYFYGLKNPEKAFSQRPKKGVWTDQWFEEPPEMTFESVLKAKTRLRGKYKGQAGIHKRQHFTFNPISKYHWLRTKLIPHFEIADKFFCDGKMLIQHSTHRDNYFLEDQDHENYEDYKNFSPYMHDVFCRGLWGVVGDRAFSNIKAVRITDAAINRMEKHLHGLDWGYNPDPFHFSSSSVVGGDLYTFREIRDVGQHVEQIYPRLSFIGNQHVSCDTNRPEHINKLNQFGLKAVGAHKPNGVRADFVQWTNGRTWYIDPERCPKLFDEATTYTYAKNKDGNSIPGEFVDGNDHGIDSVMYGIRRVMRNHIPSHMMKSYRSFGIYARNG